MIDKTQIYLSTYWADTSLHLILLRNSTGKRKNRTSHFVQNRILKTHVKMSLYFLRQSLNKI